MEFVNFKIAKLLKEAGFDEPCFGFYYEKPHPSFNHEEMLVLYKADREQTDYTANLKSFKQSFISIVNAPTTEQVINWFKEKFGVYLVINLTYQHGVKNNLMFDFYINFVEEKGLKTVKSNFSYNDEKRCISEAITCVLKDYILKK